MGIYADGTYARANPGWHAEDSAWKARKIAAFLDRHSLAPVRIGEIGCGAGGVLAALAGHFPSATFEGWDVAEEAIAMARSHESPRMRFFCGDALAARARSYDVLIAADVIEHVEDPFAFAREARRLAPWKVFHVPLDMNVQTIVRGRRKALALRHNLGHLHYFSRDTAIFLLEECGYRVADWEYTTPQLDREVMRGAPSTIAWPLRAAAFRAAPHFTTRTLGGVSMLILAQ